MVETLSLQVAAGVDDIRHKSDHSVSQVGHTLGIVGGAEYEAGMRFVGVQLLRRTNIRFACITHTARSTRAGQAVDQDIYGAADDNAYEFAGTDADYHRTLTTAHADWIGPESWTQDKEYDGPNISEVIQEIVNRGGWQAGNAIMLFSLDSGNVADGNYLEAYQYGDDPAKASKLYIEYETPVEPITTTQSLMGLGRPQGNPKWTGPRDGPRIVRRTGTVGQFEVPAKRGK